MRMKPSSERGAIIVQTLLALFVLMGISMFVVDYGVLWVARNQAQNAADAGALAGAVSLALDSYSDRSNNGPAKRAARTFALENNVFGAKGTVDFADIIFYPDDEDKFPATCSDDSCVRVDVYRNQARSNALPTFFGMFVGLNQQGVRATATAQAMIANASDCLKPWAVADKWEEHYPITKAWAPTDEFQPTPPGGATPDFYQPQDGDSPGTGFTLAADLGTEIRLKVGSPGDAINPGWFQPVDLTGGGGSQYRYNIHSCAGVTYGIGDYIPKENGNMVGPTGQGTGDLIDKDPTAQWDPVGKRVINSCVGPPYTCSEPGYQQSPRIVALPIFDLGLYMATGGPGNGTIRIVNILGFFVDRVENPQNTVFGYLAAKADLKSGAHGNVSASASFIKTIRLVR